MIDRDVYRQTGGLAGSYVGGDNEDSDLCLRLLQEGFENWYLPDAELYHLEGQSLPEGVRKLTRRYNDWLQTRTWNQEIESVMDAYTEPAVELVIPSG
jgi:GT2 family glycosyltransferase